MPQDACHAKSSTKLLKLNNSIVLAHIADSKRHDPDNSNIVQGFALDRFAIFGNQRPSSQRGKLRPAAVLDQNLTTLLWFQGDIQHNVTARLLEDESIWTDIADRVNR
ncbi:Uncharacterised protein [Klebsiella pneumoniae]|nr:Uncharacterised protein [Klebsiella pneumoniae]